MTTQYLNDQAVGMMSNPTTVDRATRIEDSDLADDTPITGALLKAFHNQIVDALSPLRPYRPHRVALAFLIEINFINGDVGGDKPDAGQVPAGYIFMDTANSDEVQWSDGASWRGLDDEDRLIDVALISLRNLVAGKVGVSSIEALVDNATPAADTLRKIEILINSLQTGLSAKIDTGALQTELQSKVFAASQVIGILDPSTIPASVRAAPIVSAGDLSNLTTEQLERIGEGSAVVLSSGPDSGKTFYYTGVGSKTDLAQYVEGADASPDVSQVSGLVAALAAKADEAPALYRPLPNYGTDGTGAAADSDPVSGPGGYVHGENVHPYEAVTIS